MAYGDIPQNGIGDPAQFRFPRGVMLKRDLSQVLPVDPTDTGQVREEVAHSWYDYPERARTPCIRGKASPRRTTTGPKPPYQQLDENGKYSWLKAPRWKGQAMEVGPLARMLVGYASGRADFKDVVDEALGRLKLPATALFSTLGRTAARGLETRLAVRWLLEEYEHLVANIKAGDTATANTSSWDPADLARRSQRLRLHRSAARRAGPLGPHRNGKIDNYQIVVPSTWNASPKDGKGQHGAYEAALLDTPMADPQRPIEILRTIHSFDPCLACASHLMGPDGRTLAEVVVR